MTVVDASAVVDLLAPPDVARREYVLAQLPEAAQPWLAPDILVFEVFSVIRRHLLRGMLGGAPARSALRHLRRLPIELVPTGALLDSAWALRERFSAGDSLYTALALHLDEPLLTTDVRLARAAEDAGVRIQTPPA